MSEKPKLKNCPFCGLIPGKGIPVDDRPLVLRRSRWINEKSALVIACPKCWAHGPSHAEQNVNEAIAAWNKRAKA
jgi:hypothetical protein